MRSLVLQSYRRPRYKHCCSQSSARIFMARGIASWGPTNSFHFINSFREATSFNRRASYPTPPWESRSKEFGVKEVSLITLERRRRMSLLLPCHRQYQTTPMDLVLDLPMTAMQTTAMPTAKCRRARRTPMSFPRSLLPPLLPPLLPSSRLKPKQSRIFLH